MRIKVGQVYNASLDGKMPTRDHGFFHFKILHSTIQYNKEKKEMETLFLGVKLSVSVGISSDNADQTWWFDDGGLCGFGFQLKRRVKHKE
jgi:hypothetical protein